MFDIAEIMANVPHRYPFLLIDRIVEFDAGVSATALKNVTINEAQFQGHFPGYPVFPGVYIIENMAQTACFLLAKSGGGVQANTVYYLGKVDKTVFKRPVRPGDQLLTTVTIEKSIANAAIVTAKARVDGELVAKGELMFASAAV